MKIRFNKTEVKSITHLSGVKEENCEYYINGQWIKEEDLKHLKLQKEIEFGEGYKFEETNNLIRDTTDKPIVLTRLEYRLLALLVENKGQLVEYEAIKEVVWKGKNMSIYTVRNIVNKIRQKTYYEIIKNESNKGYIVN